MQSTFSNPFEADGRWFKGNLHTHTSNSDGEMSPQKIVKAYEEAGYDFLSITDHGKLTDVEELTSQRLLLIPGEEVCVGSSENGKFFHIVGVGIRGAIPVNDFDRSEAPQRAINLIREVGGEAIIAHPYWSGLIQSDLVGLQGHLGLEVYNTTCELDIGKGLSSVHWDDLLTKGLRLLGFAVDDAHSKERPYLPQDSCRAWINVKAESFTEDSIMDSIRRGLFYSSNGPEIRNIEIEDDNIKVSSSPARSITFISNEWLGQKNTAETGTIEEACYTLIGGETYVRIEVTDREGRTAWSNPFYIEG